MGGRHAPVALPLWKSLGGSQGQSGRVRKISPSPEFDPRTAQPVANHYTDWAIPAHSRGVALEKKPLVLNGQTAGRDAQLEWTIRKKEK